MSSTYTDRLLKLFGEHMTEYQESLDKRLVMFRVEVPAHQGKIDTALFKKLAEVFGSEKVQCTPSVKRGVRPHYDKIVLSFSAHDVS